MSWTGKILNATVCCDNMANMKREIQTLKQLISDIMSSHEIARNSDKQLIFLVLKYLNLIADTGHGYYLLHKNIPELPSFQSIRLVRQIIQNQEGRLLPTDPKVRKLRKINEDDMKAIHTWEKDTCDDDINRHW